MTIYKSAVTTLTIAKLTEFLKLPAVSAILEIEEWADLRAPAKRDQFVEALAASSEFRKEFATFYNATVPDKPFDWMQAEQEFLAGPTPDPVPVPEAAPATPDAPAIAAEAAPPAPTPPATTGEIVPMPAPKKGKGKADSATLPGSPMVGQFVEGAFDQIVSDAAGLNAEQANQAVHAAEEDLEFHHLRLGVLLNHINAAQHFKALGYETLQDYLDAETGLHYRKAMNLIKNALVVKELGIPAKDLKGVTWAALRHIVPVLTAENYKVWLEAARSMKHVSLIAAVKGEQAKAAQLPAPKADGTGGSAPADAGVSQKVFALYPDQKSNVEAAIEKAKAEGKVESTGAALDIIAAAYNGSPMAAPVAVPGAQGGLPDLSTPALRNYLTKMQADEGDAGCVRLLTLIGEIWPHIDINVDFQPAAADTAA